jgi:hypothetical protein
MIDRDPCSALGMLHEALEGRVLDATSSRLHEVTFAGYSQVERALTRTSIKVLILSDDAMISIVGNNQ